MPTNQQGSRVTDRKETDPTSMALRIERLDGQQQLLQSQVKSTIENLNSTLQAVQAEARDMSRKITDLHGLQSAHDNSRVSIDEMKAEVRSFGERMERWFTDSQRRQDTKLAELMSERDQWRIRHEAETEDAHRGLAKDIREIKEIELRAVRESVIKWLAVGFGVTLCVSTMISGFVFFLNYRFQQQVDAIANTNEDVAETRAEAERNIDKNEAGVKSNADMIHDIQLYLARGGRMPEEPYVPPSQRKGNGK